MIRVDARDSVEMHVGDIIAVRDIEGSMRVRSMMKEKRRERE
jgi:hypothetical protein